MAFKVRHSNTWWANYDKLTAEEQQVIMKAVNLLLNNPRQEYIQAK